ncbi:MAG: phosphodiester glycosidase family protein, partial [Clostridia bacterium]|nr:phosphodiester glycosidase family protein [Clostridia bacterium]
MRKTVLRRAAAALTAAWMLFTALPLAAFAQEGADSAAPARLGEALFSMQRPIAQSADLSREALAGSAPQTPVIVTYRPGGDVRPLVRYGSKLYGKSTVAAIAGSAAAEGHLVLAAVNGDFFSSSTGLPLGLVVTDGILRASGAGRPALGFLEDGSALIGTPALTMRMSGEGGEMEVHHLNKLRTPAGGVYLLTADFSGQTRHSTPGVDVILRLLEGEPRIGGEVRYLVEDVIVTDQSMTIPEGCAMLSCSSENLAHEALLALTVGTELTFTVRAEDPRWNEVREAVGTGDRLIEDGEIQSEFDSAIAGTNPRTAVGIKENGDVVLYTLDGRSAAHSRGASLAALAAEMAALGCVDAVNLDGGGSTALLARLPGDPAPTLQ